MVFNMGGDASKVHIPNFNPDDLLQSEECTKYNLEVNKSSINGETVTIFTYMSNQPKILQHILQRYQTLRHPRILRYIAHRFVTRLHIVTEVSTPLTLCMSYLTIHEVAGGLHDLVKALSFLHDQVKTPHGSLGSHAVYVTPDGVWKLARFEAPRAILSESDNINTDLHEGLLRICKELLKDVQPSDEEDDEPPEDQALWESLEDFIENGIPEAECCSDLLQHRLFNGVLVESLEFLDNITLKSPSQRLQFFSTISPKLSRLPGKVFVKRLLRPLCSRIVLQQPEFRSYLLPALLTPKSTNEEESFGDGILSRSLFTKHIVPHIERLYKIREKDLRLILLENLHLYMNSVAKETLRYKIMPQIIQGLHATDVELVCATLHSLSSLVQVLGASAVIGTPRVRVFKSSQLPNAKHQPDLLNGAAKPLRVARVPSQRSASRTDSEASPPKPSTPKRERPSSRLRLGTPLRLPHAREGAAATDESSGASDQTAHRGLKLNRRDSTTDDSLASGMDGKSSSIEQPVTERIPSLDMSASENGWDDWEDQELELPETQNVKSSKLTTSRTTADAKSPKALKLQSTSIKSTKPPKQPLDDFSNLDIKSTALKKSVKSQEYDFFAEMTPESSSPAHPQTDHKVRDAKPVPQTVSDAFTMRDDGDASSSGWDDEETGWEW